ncbi:MAG: hypothetical protein Q4P14_05410 [Methanobacteriaceae archaeon]|nr:hypothetical protein [Methanobacteriaceae archaeon]
MAKKISKAVKAKKTTKKPIKRVVKVNKPIRSERLAAVTKNNSSNKATKKSMPFVIAIVAVVIIAILIALFANKSRNTSITPVKNIEELTKNLDVKIQEPRGANSVSYGIENKNTARIDYKKIADSGLYMDFILKSSAEDGDLLGYENDFTQTPILMTSKCYDGTQITVESYVATDDSGIMISTWEDKGLHYAMATEDLTTREDFLQEVNRVVINTHEDR